MLRGLSTVSFFADDVMAAQAWYAELLGIEPYFVRPAQGTPAYVEFRIGDYQHELGIIDSRLARHGRPDKAAGAVIYWHVDDVQGAYDRLISMRDGVRGAGRARARIRHRVGRRPVREHPRRHVQPALPGGSRVMNTFAASATDGWRAWLARNCRSEKEVWLVIQHSGSGTPSPRYHEAVEHALCYGWIDSHARKHDADSCILRFTPRKPRSTWSRVNRDRAAKMTEQGLMTEHGQALIDLAKATGTWQVMSDAHSSAIPPDLQELLDRKEAARQNFHNFPPSSKRLILEWIAQAKRPDTRQRRISQTVSLAALNIRANHPRDEDARCRQSSADHRS